MNRVLADTGPLYALADPSDAMHARARAELERLVASGGRILACRPTICEAHALILRRLGGGAALVWLDEVTAGCGSVNPSAAHYDAAAARLVSFPDQPITLFDAVLAELAEHLGVPAWTYDHHFDVMGVAVWR